MATKVKRCIGTIACLVCGVEIPARVNDSGTLDMGCGYCDFIGYAKPGTEAHDELMKSVNRKEVPAEPRAPPGMPPAMPSAAPVVPSQVEDTTAAVPEAPKKAGLSWMP